MQGGRGIDDPEAVDMDTPNAARVYDYLLGGGHNFAVDRQFAETLLTQVPMAAAAARANRAFLRRAVIYLADRGIRQFLDLGSGIPTVGNVHEITDERRPGCRVVYVDKDPLAHIHSRQLLRSHATASAVRADLRDVEGVLSSIRERELLDFEKPIAVLLCAVLHFVSDEDDPAGIVSRYTDAVPAGSYLAISHATADHRPTDLGLATRIFDHERISVTARTLEEVRALFRGVEFVEPGVVPTGRWRPADPDSPGPESCLGYAGVGFKPGAADAVDEWFRDQPAATGRGGDIPAAAVRTPHEPGCHLRVVRDPD